MPQIPKTFCPAKWDELYLNFNYNYAYSCCKATPIKFVNSYSEVIAPQKQNLLNGVQDPSCTYCWDLENAGRPSTRLEYLSKMQNFNSYQDRKPSQIEINLGNECNFQCMYCNPKFSSRWQADVESKPYNIDTDLAFYSIDAKEPALDSKNIEFIQDLGKVDTLILIGGEPLYNKKLWPIIDQAQATQLVIVTNLSCGVDKIDKLLSYQDRFDSIGICVSLDSTGEMAEFIRNGTDFAALQHKLEYVANKLPDSGKLHISSLMTSLSIRDIENTIKFVGQIHKRNTKLTWRMFPCINPKIQSFSTLPEAEKVLALESLAQLSGISYLSGSDIVREHIINSVFSERLYIELQDFLREYAVRTNTKIPTRCLD